MLDAALSLVEKEGLDGLTIARLAKELGCAVGAIYRYFDGKPALLVAMQEQAIRRLDDDVARSVERSRRRAAREGRHAPVEHLLAAIEPFSTLPTRDPARHRLIDELLSAPAALLSDEQLRAVNRVLAPLLERIETLLLEAAQHGAVSPGDARVRTRLLWAALHGLDHFRKRDRVEPPALRVESLQPELVRTLLAGWGYVPEAASAPQPAKRRRRA